MSPKINIALQPPSVWDDQIGAMALPLASSDASTQRDDSRLTLGDLAHELNSLLDGSLRSLGLAQKCLDDAADSSGPAVQDVVHRLEAAQQSMRRMAMVLERAMLSGEPSVGVFDDQQTLGQVVTRLCQLLEPMARNCGVEVRCEIEPLAASIPALTLEPVILNGLRNAIQACGAGSAEVRRVELCVSLTPIHEVQILITDTGPGLPPGLQTNLPAEGDCPSHGLGLAICRKIVHRLRGTLRLMNVPFASGAVLQVSVPLRSLSHDGR